MKGGQGLRLAGFAVTSVTARSRPATALTAIAAAPASGRSNRSSFFPASDTSVASYSAPPGVASRAWTDQYSRARNASISISRSTIRRRQTDCTRPADFAPGSLRHRTGDRLKPTR